MTLQPPKNAGELRPFKDHVWINLKGNWRIQKTVKNCNRQSSWDLLTHPKYSKIHLLQRSEFDNFKGEQVFYYFDANDMTWILTTKPN